MGATAGRRFFDPKTGDLLEAMWAEPGSKLQVTITASNYGAFGQVVETLPDLFTLERTSLDDSQYDNDSEPREVLFYLLGETSFNYVVTVPAMEGPTPSPASSRTLNAGSSASRATRSFRSAAANAYTTPEPTPTLRPRARLSERRRLLRRQLRCL